MTGACLRYRGGTRAIQGVPLETLHLGVVATHDECMIWPHGTTLCNGRRYGAIRYNGRGRTVHRTVLQIASGESGTRLHARHRCGVFLCFNHNHLEWGTASQNQQDRRRHGTALFKTTENDVRAMRIRYDAGDISQTQLAKEFGISPRSVSEIVRRVVKTWILD